MAIVRSQSARVSCSNGLAIKTPALLIRASTGPRASTTWRTTARTSASSLTSPGRPAARTPASANWPSSTSRLSAVRAQQPTCHPARPSAKAVARPIPWVAPVTRAVRVEAIAEKIEPSAAGPQGCQLLPKLVEAVDQGAVALLRFVGLAAAEVNRAVGVEDRAFDFFQCVEAPLVGFGDQLPRVDVKPAQLVLDQSAVVDDRDVAIVVEQAIL